jgi:hypothetical protein
MEIRFSYETKYGMFSDALILPDDHTFTESEITSMKEQRRDNWVAYIDSTQVDNPTGEQITQEVSQPAVEETPQDTEPTP